MTNYSTVTQKGQITLPKEVREAAGIYAYGKVEIKFDKENKSLLIRPKKDLLDNPDILKTKIKGKKKNVLDARDYLENNYSGK